MFVSKKITLENLKTFIEDADERANDKNDILLRLGSNKDAWSLALNQEVGDRNDAISRVMAAIEQEKRDRDAAILQESSDRNEAIEAKGVEVKGWIATEAAQRELHVRQPRYNGPLVKTTF